MTIKVPATYSLHEVIVSHGWASLAPFECNEARTRLDYVDRLSSGRVVAHTLTQPRKHIQARLSEEVSAAEKREIRKRLTAMLQTNVDLSTFYAAADGEAKLLNAIECEKGRLLRAPTVFEDMVKVILTTNTTWSGTMRMVGNLVRLWGDKMGNGDDRCAFPAPDVLAVVSDTILQKDAGLGYRAPHIRTLSRAIADGELDVEAFRSTTEDTPSLRKKLLSINGIGPYAAASLLMLFGRFDHLPIDSWAIKLVSHEWYNGKPVKPADVERAFEKWGRWKGLAFWFWDWNYLHDPVTGEDANS